MFQFQLYFSASFAFYFLVSYTLSQTSAMFSFKIEMLNSSANSPLQISFINFYVPIATLKILLNMAVLK